MKRNELSAIALGICASFFGSGATCRAQGQIRPAPSGKYSQMAPIDQYLAPNRDDEIALAKSAAPDSISSAAEVMVLGLEGYTTSAKGKNGFVCMVLRSWTTGFDDPEFWNPKVRSPICFNPPAVRTYLPIIILRTSQALAGRSKYEILDALSTAFEKKELPALEPGAMCYMMSKSAHLSDRDGSWNSHLMFFLPLMDASAWGANLPGSPVLGAEDKEDRLVIFLIPVGWWSDGTAAPTP